MIKVALDRQGDPALWGVVRQVDHARLAFDLAERSVLLDELPPAVRSEILCAIDHHDDGWQERDLTIEIDRQQNRPRTFDEMTAAEAIDIWSRSIDRARGFGTLSAWTVAGHFAYLAMLKQGADRAQSTEWARKIDIERAERLARWLSDDPNHSHIQADIALSCLKLFDSLSLFVIGIGSEPERCFTLPDGTRATVVRSADGTYAADPWFFDRDDLALGVSGFRVSGTEIMDVWSPTLLLRRAAS